MPSQPSPATNAGVTHMGEAPFDHSLRCRCMCEANVAVSYSTGPILRNESLSMPFTYHPEGNGNTVRRVALDVLEYLTAPAQNLAGTQDAARPGQSATEHSSTARLWGWT
ncbi:MAG: hypothetical protein KDA52_01245 [Planctomycetaceae bacterium]|nr:hypothetical protein [Planctomycetaceae bacterium]